MSAVPIVEGVLEGIQLIQQLINAAGTVANAAHQAQLTGVPLDLSATGPILTQEAQAENAVLAAIAAAKAAGK